MCLQADVKETAALHRAMKRRKTKRMRFWKQARRADVSLCSIYQRTFHWRPGLNVSDSGCRNIPVKVNREVHRGIHVYREKPTFSASGRITVAVWCHADDLIAAGYSDPWRRPSGEAVFTKVHLSPAEYAKAMAADLAHHSHPVRSL